MNAVVFHEHGGPGKLQYQEMPTPTIGPHEVLVRVKACALNHLDVWIRQGSPAYPMPLPHISGSDIAGTLNRWVTMPRRRRWATGSTCLPASAAGIASTVSPGRTTGAAHMD